MKKKSFVIIGFVLFLNIFAFKTLFSESVEEKWPNGKTQKRFSTDSENKKSGEYAEYFENGQLKIKCYYKKDDLDGLYQEYFEDGKKCQETQYSKGLKNGVSRFYQKGAIIKDEQWINGILAFPKTQAEITRVLASIPKLKTEIIGEWPKDFKVDRFSKAVEADNTSGLTKLREYRYLCELDYEDLTLNRPYIVNNLDAVIILNKINRLDHTPPNPGLPEDVYKSGYEGTSHSNLASGGRGVSGSGSIDMYMNDSDKSNIDRVGHRRWCLNPSMKTVGFGTEGSYSALWAHNASREKIPDYDFISFPAKGFMPSTHFNSSYAWSVSLNPALYKTPDKATVNVKISLVKGALNNELKISYQNIELSGFGINNAIIFKPDSVSVSPKTRYHVVISGLKNSADKDAKIEYYVEFF